jgi:anti-sigma28 factor (negative regulator of flagellin synthesis)
MKVNDTSSNQAAASELAKARETAAAPSTAKKDAGELRTTGDSDMVQLSNLSARLLQLISTESPERASRLEWLAAEVRSGRYEVNSLDVSRRIIDEALRHEP